MRIGIGWDHVGFARKGPLLEALEQDGHAVLDLGTFSPEPVDYPDLVRAVANAVRKGFVEAGILIAETGVGAAIAANKLHGIRAAFCDDLRTARQSREHTNANLLCLDAGLTDVDAALQISREWLGTPFSTNSRHARLLAKMELEKGPAPPLRAQAAANPSEVSEPAAKIPEPAAASESPAAALPPEVSSVETFIASLADPKLRAMTRRVLAFLGPIFPDAEGAVDSAGRNFTLTMNGVHVATVFVDDGSLRFEAGSERVSSGKIKDLKALEGALALPSILKALQAVKHF